MIISCSCSNMDCLVNGCLIVRRHQQNTFAPPDPNRSGQTFVQAPMSEERMRQIIREEIGRATKPPGPAV